MLQIKYLELIVIQNFQVGLKAKKISELCSKGVQNPKYFKHQIGDFALDDLEHNLTLL